MTPQERLRQRNRFAKHTKKAERSELADSRLFDLVAAVWHLHREKFNPNTKDLQFRALATRLMKAVIELDVDTLQEVTDICNQLQDMPRDGRLHEPINKLDFLILTFPRRHGRAPKHQELMKWVGPKMGWTRGEFGWDPTNERQLRRHCESLRKSVGFRLVQSKRGPSSA